MRIRGCVALFVTVMVAGATAFAQATAAKVNLIPVGDFENASADTKLPAKWSALISPGAGTVQVDDTAAHSGKSSLHCAYDAKADPKASGDVIAIGASGTDLEAGKTYTISAWVKTKDLGGRAYIDIYQYPAPFPEGAYVRAEKMLSGTNDWTLVSITFKTRKDIGGLQIRLGAGGPEKGEAWFDDLTLVEGTPEAAPAPTAK